MPNKTSADTFLAQIDNSLSELSQLATGEDGSPTAALARALGLLLFIQRQRATAKDGNSAGGNSRGGSRGAMPLMPSNNSRTGFFG